VVSWSLLYGPPLLISNNSKSTFGNLENGTAVLEAVFTEGATVTFHVTPGHAGTIYALGAAGYSAVAGGSSMAVALGTYGFAAVPSVGWVFTSWSTNSPSAISFSPTAVDTDATILGGGSITANFVKTTTTSTLTVGAAPNVKAGTLMFDLGSTFAGGSVLKAVTSGEHTVTANPSMGYAFVDWKTSGKASLVGSAFTPTTVISLAKGSGSVTPVFAPILVPLSFVVWNPTGTSTSTGTLTVNGLHLSTGQTAWLKPGTYTVSLSAPAPLSSWQPDGGLTILSSTGTTAKVMVTTGGTLEADLK
jgi:hypothetical protein